MGIGPLAKKLDVDRDQLKELAAGARVAATRTQGAAVNAYEWTTPRVEAFVEWLTPRLEHLYTEGLKAAAPQVEKAAGKAAPVVDTAHEKIVDELLPKLVAAVHAAADKAQAAEDEAARLAAQAAQRKSHTARKVFLAAALTAGGIAAAAAWARSRTTVDPWAEPWEPTEAPARTGLEDKVGEAADAVGEAAGSAVAKSREATRKAGEKLAEAREEVSEKIAEAREEISEKIEEISDKAKDATKKVTRRAKTDPDAETDQDAAASGPAKPAGPTAKPTSEPDLGA
ncbi:MAG: hypothetical protein FWH11_07095 [Micrococcales bacterium]|nr:hypothetical protein [Micrococcales bacterium]